MRLLAKLAAWYLQRSVKWVVIANSTIGAPDYGVDGWISGPGWYINFPKRVS